MLNWIEFSDCSYKSVSLKHRDPEQLEQFDFKLVFLMLILRIPAVG